MTTTPKVQRPELIPKREIRALMVPPPTRDDALSKRTGHEVWVFDDGRVLMLRRDGKGLLWPSREPLEEFNRQIEELVAKGPVDLTRELLPPIDDFLRDVDAHAASLGARLRVPEQALGRTQESLDAVDKGVWRIAQAKRMTPEIVTPLVAYVGEVMRLACDGRWTSAPTRGGAEPTVTARDGRLFQPFAIVIGEVERGRRGSLRGAVAGTLGAHVLSAT